MHPLHHHPTKAFVVTGSNGYIGRWLVHELLEELHRNDGTDKSQWNSINTLILCLVRSKNVAKEEEYWKDFDPCKASLIRVFPYDMLDHGKSLELALNDFLSSCGNQPSAANGLCPTTICVFHVASVFGPTDDHTQTALDNVRGTVDLVTCLGRLVEERSGIYCRPPHVKLIVTSSMAAVRGTGQSPVNGQYYTASDWNTLSELGTNWGSSYQWSKVESERQAWNLCRLYNMPMVALCPSFVFGPPASNSPASSYSMTLVNEWIHGESPVQSRLFVDIRDVAKAHVKAAMQEAAIGKRYLISTEARIPSQQIAVWLQDVCRTTGWADPNAIQYDAEFAGGSIPIGSKEVEATESLRDDLGIMLRPVKDTILDMAQFILARE